VRENGRKLLDEKGKVGKRLGGGARVGLNFVYCLLGNG
jgi:hypothetical protein